MPAAAPGVPPGPVPQPAAGYSGGLHHTSLPDGLATSGTTPAPGVAAVLGSHGLGTTAMSLPTALPGFSMYGGGVWSPSAVTADGKLDGWAGLGTAPAPVRGGDVGVLRGLGLGTREHAGVVPSASTDDLLCLQHDIDALIN
jgi:hypothetical protein